MSDAARRAQYEAAVRGLRTEADRLLAEGVPIEEVAIQIVTRRNNLKLEARSLDPRAIVAAMEARNRRRYGNGLGPDPVWCLAKYGSWEAVIEAACRHAFLKGRV